MVWKRAGESSDYDPTFLPPPKHIRRALSLPPSSPPPPETPGNNESPRTPEAGPFTLNSDAAMEDFDMVEPLPALFALPSSGITASGSGPAPQTPQRSTLRARSLEPRPSSPMSMVDVTPLKPRAKLGRPKLTPQTRRLKKTVQKFASSQLTPDRDTVKKAKAELEEKAALAAASRMAEKERLATEAAESKAHEKKLAAEQKAKEEEARQAIVDAKNTIQSRPKYSPHPNREVIRLLSMSETDGGFAFKNLEEFFDALWCRGGDANISSLITEYVQRHGAAHAEGMFTHSKEAKEEFISDTLSEIFQEEGRAIQAILTRDSTTTVMELLKDFSMDLLAEEIRAAAPHLWAALAVLATPDQSTRRESDGDTQRNKGLHN
ncbi:hypothetical protein C8F04DRAFT_1274108 [Mycena alexandri]|uniref:Uncharacterized protein n=1 Tax=Mycena alexandri TaxID=1745969 RepID=A0AAD6S4T9_9AGAR|nr:hypothetical protein C8F04DRAFT_1274108 [Mycena alexandri]